MRMSKIHVTPISIGEVNSVAKDKSPKKEEKKQPAKKK
jgi:hypothetical protein